MANGDAQPQRSAQLTREQGRAIGAGGARSLMLYIVQISGWPRTGYPDQRTRADLSVLIAVGTLATWETSLTLRMA
jgi:hypothetical protein